MVSGFWPSATSVQVISLFHPPPRPHCKPLRKNEEVSDQKKTTTPSHEKIPRIAVIEASIQICYINQATESFLAQVGQMILAGPLHDGRNKCSRHDVVISGCSTSEHVKCESWRVETLVNSTVTIHRQRRWKKNSDAKCSDPFNAKTIPTILSGWQKHPNITQGPKKTNIMFLQFRGHTLFSTSRIVMEKELLPLFCPLA